MAKKKAYIETPRGRIIKTKSGGAQLRWNTEFKPKWDGNYNNAQEYVDTAVLRLSEPYLPFRIGILKKSGLLGTEIGSGTVIYNAPYAHYQYYGIVYEGKAPKQPTDRSLTYSGAPKRGKLWFERMKADHKNRIIKGAARIAGGGSE